MQLLGYSSLLLPQQEQGTIIHKGYMSREPFFFFSLSPFPPPFPPQTRPYQPSLSKF